MRKHKIVTRVLIPVLLMMILAACEESKPDDIYKQLEEKAKITTFPLTIVITDRLAGEEFPDDLKTLCTVSEGPCRTLPVSGILRIGPDQYYTYNSISSLKVASSEGDDEKSLASSVKQQVAGYFLKTSLKDYDSLRSPNHAYYNMPLLSADYIRTTQDSIFFYSASPSTASTVSIGERTYPVYKDAGELRRNVDALICKKQATISIFYSPGPALQPSAATLANAPSEGIFAGDTCIGTSKFERRNDGKGNYFVGKLVEENSKSCGFAFPTGVAGDTCIGKAKYQRLHNGKGGFVLGALLEKNSVACGFKFPIGVAGDTCVSGSKYQKMHDGRGGFVLGNLLEKNSRSCGFTFPARGSVVAGFMCYQGSKYEKLNDGSGGFIRGKLVQANSNDCIATRPAAVVPPVVTTKPAATKPVTPPVTTRQPPVSAPAQQQKPTATDNRCARSSDPICEQDGQGNYTGRRIQYCYNSSGKIVRTIVLSKCDADCRCLGK